MLETESEFFTEKNRRVALILNKENHPDNRTLYQAMKREYAIKQLGRKEKQKLIAGKKVKLSDERKEKEN